MNDKLKPDWDPRSEDVLRDQRTAYDEMRQRCTVAYSEFMQWSLFRHEDITRVLHDHETFSNYGAGIHVCPGAPLVRMELQVIMEELLKRTSRIQPVPDKLPTTAVYPASGFATLPLEIR